ncbi:MAG: FAD-dependent oxidoreductase [Elusimicrobia bacterium]|nr:FAD-dependent oxidoreductase [Elusimicrobiota bacterium]
MTAPPVVVLGGGCAGLCAAWRLKSLGFSVILLEREDHVGGLAGGIRIGGSVYEYGPHVFHTTDPQILADIKSIMGDELRPYRRTIQIKFLGNYFQFPLRVSDVLFKLPPWTIVMAGASFAYRFVEGALVKPKVENSETVLLRYYGDVLYKIFFKDYILRVWGIPPAQFSPAFARERIPRLNILEWLEGFSAFARRGLARARPSLSTRGYVEKVEGPLYTTEEGFSLITRRMGERLAAAGAEIRLATEVSGLRREGKRLAEVLSLGPRGKEALACRGVVNTLPVNEFAGAISPGLGAEVEAAAAQLRFRAIVFVGLKVRRPKVLPASFMYFREHSFNRITDLAHFAFKIEPAGRTLLVAEIACDPRDRFWSDDSAATQAVVADLVRENLLTRAEIEESHVFRARHAHPMYTLGYEDALRTLLAALAGLENVETAGRQGRFQYVNTHVAMKMGYEVADRLAARLGAP